MTSSSAPIGSINIVNKTGETLNIYNFNYGAPAAVSAITVAEGATHNLPMTVDTPQMRTYFSTDSLQASCGSGTAPDAFNPTFDGDKRYSFAEYYYEKTAKSAYTVDLSFIDAFSYPVSIKFSDDPSTEWGLTSMSEVASKLTGFWKDLVWNDGNKILRIVGPNKAMHPAGSAPQGAVTFGTTNFPPTGKTLSPNNWDAWQTSTTEPATTDYVKALREASLGQKENKYGFFTYPRDNENGEFTYVPEAKICTLTVYPAG